MYWFPHTDRLLTKRNNRTLDDPEPLSRLRGWFDDEFLSNRVFGWLNRLGNARPGLVPRINHLSARALSERRYSDVPHQVFTSRRGVVFREMEYGVPREAGLEALADVRALIERSDWRISFPVEIRSARPTTSPSRRRMPATRSTWPSTPTRRPTTATTSATSRTSSADTTAAPTGASCTTARLQTLSRRTPAGRSSRRMRDRLDPDRLFTNAYLERVLGY